MYLAGCAQIDLTSSVVTKVSESLILLNMKAMIWYPREFFRIGEYIAARTSGGEMIDDRFLFRTLTDASNF
jgi:hypothetical protein